MESTVFCNASELSPEQRQALGSLLGHDLENDEWITVQTSKSRIISRALTGPAGEEAYRKMIARIDETASRASGVPEAEIDDAIEEALAYVRSHPE